jgi:hypothetical protein
MIAEAKLGLLIQYQKKKYSEMGQLVLVILDNFLAIKQK